jgi:RNA polymerase sigma-70 factor (ECF subfamily)
VTDESHFQQREPALIQRARSGDREAQQALWRAHRRWVAAIVMAHRPRSVEVDDLMQDVAIKFVSRLPTLRDPGAFRPWMRQIVINACRGAARHLRPTLRLSEPARGDEEDRGRDAAAPPPAREGEAHPALERSEAARLVLDQLLTLPPEYREPMLLRCVRSLSYQEISDLLGLPVTTIETRLARARRMLRQEVGEELAERP